jgi:hypothetical protein
MMLVQLHGPCQGSTANLWKTAVAGSGLMGGPHSEKRTCVGPETCIPLGRRTAPSKLFGVRRNSTPEKYLSVIFGALRARSGSRAVRLFGVN